jgi:hypothetical protein
MHVILSRRLRRRARAIAGRATSLALLQRHEARLCLEGVAAVAVFAKLTWPIDTKLQGNLAAII